MPRKGYRSLTLPEDVYRTLQRLSRRTYRTSPARFIEERLMDLYGNVNIDDDSTEESKRRVSGTSRTFSAEKVREKDLIISNLDEFRTWLSVRRRISDETAHRYIMVLEKFGPVISPSVIMEKYDRWLYVSCRLFVRYSFHAGIMTNDSRVRWLDLLRIQEPWHAPESEEISADRVRALLACDDATGFLHALYYSGIRITDAVYFFNNCSTFEHQDFDGFMRWKVGYSRGMKKCEYCYLPSDVEPHPIALDLSHFARRMPCNPKLLRKFFYRTAKACALEERADPLIVDFYQSRLSRMSIGERHYGYLREEADRLYPKVLARLKAIQ